MKQDFAIHILGLIRLICAAGSLAGSLTQCTQSRYSLEILSSDDVLKVNDVLKVKAVKQCCFTPAEELATRYPDLVLCRMHRWEMESPSLSSF